MEEPPNSSEPSGAPKRKWKKKKSFMSNARKYGKKECWGRGSKIEGDMYQYLVGILEVMKEGFDTPQDKQNFVNNVLERTVGEELSLACNQLGCRVLEALIPFSDSAALERFTAACSAELRALCTDNFSSFVLEALLVTCCQRGSQSGEGESVPKEEEGEPPMKKKKKDKIKEGTDEEKIDKVGNTNEIKNDKDSVEYTEEHVKNCKTFFMKLCKYLLNNLEDFVFDPSANRILRTALRCLAGVKAIPGERPKQSLFGQKVPIKSVKQQVGVEYVWSDPEHKELAQELGRRLAGWPQLASMTERALTSGLLQELLYALSACSKKQTRQLCRQLLDQAFAPPLPNEDGPPDDKDMKPSTDATSLSPVFNSIPAVHLLEAALHVARGKTFTQIYARCFINRLAQLATMHDFNFTVQRLIDNCEEKEEFEGIFDELSPAFESILVSGNTGVVVGIAKACQRLQCRQAKFLQSLEHALGCEESGDPQELLLRCVNLIPKRRVAKNQQDNTALTVSVHGSVILQTLLSFQRPKRAVDAVLATPPDLLVQLLCDPKGSHVGDAFCQGPFVGVKSKELLIKRLTGTYHTLALSKHGSRALERIFSSVGLPLQERIMQELADKPQLLAAQPCGRLVAANLRLQLYCNSVAAWRNTAGKKQGKEELFKNILEKKNK